MFSNGIYLLLQSRFVLPRLNGDAANAFNSPFDVNFNYVKIGKNEAQKPQLMSMESALVRHGRPRALAFRLILFFYIFSSQHLQIALSSRLS